MQDTNRRVTLRSATPADAEVTSRICFEAFSDISRRHNFPPDFPAPEVAAGVMGMILNAPFVWGVVAEHNGRVVGSNFLWEWEPIAGVGPVTVDPSAQDLSVGRRMMEAVMQRAAERRFAGVRLVQAGYNTRSLSLYTKLGFDVREPLVCLNGDPVREAVPGHDVRPAAPADLDACADVCRRVHGHDRTDELSSSIARGTARVVEQAGRVVGYMSELGFFGHCVALTNDGLRALIGGGDRITGPGMLLPSRNGEVFRWCLSKGLKHVQPLTLMSHGLYNEPRGAFMPSILY
ncbi:MAG TPA: GNAT family N-acetyltransferase [Tepidisphaeraceae bacterium]|nr:GNAT family N-acetyltransferase [Tepidisphaeraceae bacterium]